MTRIKPNQSKVNYSWFILPLVIALIVVLLVFKAFFWAAKEVQVNPNEWFINITPNVENSEINIYMSWDSPKSIEWTEKMYSTDNKLEVKSWEAKIILEWSTSKIYVNKLWELKYKWIIWNEENFSIINWDNWVESSSPMKFELKNFTVYWPSWVYSFTQNMVASTVYVLKWEVTLTLNSVKNNKPITIWVGQQITIQNADLNDDTFVIEEKIEPLDDFFKEWDFFIKHNWSSYLNIGQNNWNWTWTWNELWSWTSGSKWSKAIIIVYPEDESILETNTIDIEWSINNSKVEKVTLNDKEASINKEENTFISKDFDLLDSINNVVYKAYDSDNNLLLKWVLTLYATSKEKSKENQKPTVTTYPISSKDFRIISPSENPFKTTDSIVKISWSVNKWIVKFITINDFRLTSFSLFGSSWHYFANKDYWTMNDGINLYTIKYYWKEDELLNTSLFSIVKESPEEIIPKIDESQKIETNSPINSWSWM